MVTRLPAAGHSPKLLAGYERLDLRRERLNQGLDCGHSRAFSGNPWLSREDTPQIEAIVMLLAPYVKSRAGEVRSNRDKPYQRDSACGYRSHHL